MPRLLLCSLLFFSTPVFQHKFVPYYVFGLACLSSPIGMSDIFMTSLARYLYLARELASRLPLSARVVAYFFCF